MSRRMRRAVAALLGDRRPARFDATADEAAQLRAAAMLRAAHAGADLPREPFVDALGDRLRRAVERADAGGAPARQDRRVFLRRAGLAAAAVAAGVGADRAVVAIRSDSGVDTTPPTAARETMVPDNPAWVPVATLAAVRAVPALRFRAGAVEGVLVAQVDGTVAALSAVCTHMGCLLTVDAAQRRLACPCHRATFSLDGAPNSREYLRPLPVLRARVNGDSVEVQVA